MKKLFSLILVITLCALVFTGCYKSDYALMIGVSTSQSGAEVTNTVAAIVIDKDYRIVSCRIDSITAKAKLSEEGEIVADLGEGAVAFESKAELGDRYGMLTNSPYFGSSLAEWDDQAKHFENYVVGKTREEIKNITDKDGKVSDTELTAGCTISVNDFMKAIDNAFESEHMVGLQTKGKITLGVSASADVSSKAKGIASFTSDFGAVAIVDGKILAAIIDSKEVTSKVKDDGSFTKIADKGTKLEQGDSYNMVTYGGAVAEWYEQAQAYANTAIGKTKEEVAGLSTDKIEGSCTIYVGGYKKALEKAASYAR